MTNHTHTTVTPGCYRCELGLDELAAVHAEVRAEAQAAWLAYRDKYTTERGLSGKRAASQMRRREFIAGYLAANEVDQ